MTRRRLDSRSRHGRHRPRDARARAGAEQPQHRPARSARCEHGPARAAAGVRPGTAGCRAGPAARCDLGRGRGRASGGDLLAHPRVVTTGYLGFGDGSRPAAGPGRPARLEPPVGPLEWVARGPAAVALGIGLLQAFLVSVAKSWAFWGTDLAHHMTNINTLQQAGALDYSRSSYPQGLHMLGRSCLGPCGAPLDDPGQLLAYDLQLTAALTWFALALLLWTGGSVAIRVGHTLGLPHGVPEGAAFALGVGALLTNTFIDFFVTRGRYRVCSPWLPCGRCPSRRSVAAGVRPRTSRGSRVMRVSHGARTPVAGPGDSPARGAAAVRGAAARAAASPRRPPRRLRPALAWSVLARSDAVLASLPLVQVGRSGDSPGRHRSEVPSSPVDAGGSRLGVHRPAAAHLKLPWVRLLLGSALGLVVSTPCSCTGRATASTSGSSTR